MIDIGFNYRLLGEGTGMDLGPWKLTWSLKITGFERKVIFQTSILGFQIFRGYSCLCLFMPCLRIALDMQDEPEVFWKLRTPEQDVTDVTGWKLGTLNCLSGTVDGWDPAPVDMDNVPLFTGFYISQVVPSTEAQRPPSYPATTATLSSRGAPVNIRSWPKNSIKITFSPSKTYPKVWNPTSRFLIAVVLCFTCIFELRILSGCRDKSKLKSFYSTSIAWQKMVWKRPISTKPRINFII